MIGRIAVLSPGLLGASVALAARSRRAAGTIAIWARRPETRAEISQEAWCDAAPETPEAAVRGAQLIVIASPVDAILPLLERIAPHLDVDAVVTDVGSVKGPLARGGEAVTRRLSAGAAHFVGAHPMAGSQHTGWRHASAALFEGRTCFLTPVESTPAGALRRVSEFWQSLGAEVVTVEPELHDRIVAHISHLPQVLASSLASFLAGRPSAWRGYAGNGLRDTTRIAASDPKLWAAILSANQTEVLAALRGFQIELAACERAIAAGDWEAVRVLIARGKEFRDSLS